MLYKTDPVKASMRVRLRLKSEALYHIIQLAFKTEPLKASMSVRLSIHMQMQYSKHPSLNLSYNCHS